MRCCNEQSKNRKNQPSDRGPRAPEKTEQMRKNAGMCRVFVSLWRKCAGKTQPDRRIVFSAWIYVHVSTYTWIYTPAFLHTCIGQSSTCRDMTSKAQGYTVQFCFCAMLQKNIHSSRRTKRKRTHICIRAVLHTCTRILSLTHSVTYYVSMFFIYLVKYA
jgi:hypothetical protein